MNPREEAAAATLRGDAWSTFRGRLARTGRRFYPYRPRVSDWRFWAVQGLVLVVAGTHSGAELLKILGHPVFLGNEPQVALASFVSVSLFFVPMVYAALNFGRAGSVATALWCTVLSLPNILVFHAGMEQIREALQIGIVDFIALFVGQRVDREMAARRAAEEAAAALSASEIKYRGLFESSPVAILLVDSVGAILEANPAAGDLFRRPARVLKGATLAELVGPGQAEQLLSRNENGGKPQELVLRPAKGPKVYLEPTLTAVESSRASQGVQVLLKDVTVERRRQAGLKAYAEHVLRAQEEERRRIAQELHDETIQALILVCRQLDRAEGVSESLPSGAREGVRDARQTAERVVAGLRDFARALRPPTLEDLGLVTSLRRLVMDLTERCPVKGRLQVVGQERRFPPDVELGLFRIAQEALRNVERHSQASYVTVTITFNSHETRLDVADNGVGFSPLPLLGDYAANKQLGLLGMQERAELLGGAVEIISQPGQGTRVAATFPVRKPDRNHDDHDTQQ